MPRVFSWLPPVGASAAVSMPRPGAPPAPGRPKTVGWRWSRRGWLAAVGLLILLGGLGGNCLGAGEATWKVGLARAKITPREAMWMAGYAARTRPSEGTLHDLWVKVMVLEDSQGNRGMVVTSDLLGFPRQMSESICQALEERCGLKREQIMLTSSHTHSGPVLSGALFDCYPLDEAEKERIDGYSRWLESVIIRTAVEAVSKGSPATLSAGEGETGFAANRRENRPEAVARLRQLGQPPKGPSDHRVPTLAVRSPEGDLLAVVFGYACHNTTLAGYDWCGDYAGFAQLALEEEHPGAQAMFYSGCGADQNPLPRRSVELCRQYGQMLAGAVDRVLDGPMRPLDPGLAMAFDTITLGYGEQPDRAELEQVAARSDYQARWAKRLLAEQDAGLVWETSYPYPIQAWRLGQDQLWIALGGEVVVDYALLLKDRYGPACWVAGYANDVMAYIPSRRVWEEGGYESGAFRVYGLPADRWTPRIQQEILAGVAGLVEKLPVAEPVGAE